MLIRSNGWTLLTALVGEVISQQIRQFSVIIFTSFYENYRFLLGTKYYVLVMPGWHKSTLISRNLFLLVLAQ